jgi:hypothetical protein
VKYGDLGGMLAMAAPTPLWLADPDADLVERLSRFAAAAGSPLEGPTTPPRAGPAATWLPFLLSALDSPAPPPGN